ncbi:uncharacterized protein LOC130776443 isoform X2 [Actinidia eriantha]|uniref:uncharacterized protein LOC130776443 isoform X2 n=1 Tax=Actinidia eriantha TaxID=165200 RepID=UPI00258B67C5|nr:uncharacterized protein LOC130776443 isoform X2 [Actinidia eriantha]
MTTTLEVREGKAKELGEGKGARRGQRQRTIMVEYLFGSNLFLQVMGISITREENWRMPKGIDSYVRRKFKGCTLMPNIGYGSDKKTRHGFKKFVVHNVKELEVRMIHNRCLTLSPAGSSGCSGLSSGHGCLVVIWRIVDTVGGVCCRGVVPWFGGGVV